MTACLVALLLLAGPTGGGTAADDFMSGARPLLDGEKWPELEELARTRLAGDENDGAARACLALLRWTVQFSAGSLCGRTRSGIRCRPETPAGLLRVQHVAIPQALPGAPAVVCRVRRPVSWRARCLAEGLDFDARPFLAGARPRLGSPFPGVDY